MGVFGAHLPERFKLVRDIVVFAISVYALYNINNFYIKGYIDGVVSGYKLAPNSSCSIPKGFVETICFNNGSCFECRETSYELREVNSTNFVIPHVLVSKVVNSYCLEEKDWENWHFLVLHKGDYNIVWQ